MGERPAPARNLAEETPGPPPLVLASSNPHKVGELSQLLAGRFAVSLRPVGLADTIEDGDTLEANARKKAGEVAAATSSACLADDTGLFVAALGGAPGVRTARYAGENANDGQNVAKLLEELDALDCLSPPTRRARFETVLALVWPHGDHLVVAGQVEGVIAPEPRGDAGFGYDSVFVPTEGGGRTFAEMTAEEKNSISHRARALAKLARVDIFPPPSG